MSNLRVIRPSGGSVIRPKLNLSEYNAWSAKWIRSPLLPYRGCFYDLSIVGIFEADAVEKAIMIGDSPYHALLYVPQYERTAQWLRVLWPAIRPLPEGPVRLTGQLLCYPSTWETVLRPNTWESTDEEELGQSWISGTSFLQGEPKEREKNTFTLYAHYAKPEGGLVPLSVTSAVLEECGVSLDEIKGQAITFEGHWYGQPHEKYLTSLYTLSVVTWLAPAEIIMPRSTSSSEKEGPVHAQ